MLPRGPLGRQQLKNLRIYAGAEHPHAAQEPEAARRRRPQYQECKERLTNAQAEVMTLEDLAPLKSRPRRAAGARL